MRRKNALILLAASLPALLAACAAAPSRTPPPAPPAGPPPQAATCPETRGWQVWIDAMPGPGAQLRLIVTGEVDVPAGMVATLQAGPLDRMMPPGQRIALVLKPGTGPSGWQEIRTEIKPAQSAYREVLIGCDGKEIRRIDQIETAH